MRCRKYLVVMGYVDASKLFTRAYRLLSNMASGAGGIRAYEEARRITATIDAKKLSELASFCNEYFTSCTVEVKASCKINDVNKLIQLLKTSGFTLSRTPRAILAYGIISGRIVEIEVSGNLVKVKVGSRTSISRVKPPVPTSLFIVGVDEASQTLAHLGRVLDMMEGALHA